MASKARPKLDDEGQTMLKAAFVMPDKQGIDHVTEQAGLIFDQRYEPLPVAERALSEAQKEFDRISEELEKLRRERRKIPNQTYSDPTQNEVNDSE